MENLVQAVERARAQRQQSSGEARRRALTTTPIEYTHTRVVRVPREVLEANRILCGNSSEALQPYKVLRTRISQRMRQNGWKTLGITSARPHEGKTLTAINLAISLAMEQQQTVLLVDADLRRPALHARFRLPRDKGLADHLMHGTPVEDTLVHPGISRLVLMPGSAPQHSSSELLASPRMLQLVDELRSRYPNRLVLFDLPPILAGDDVVAFAPYIDAMLLVVEEGSTPLKDLEQIQTLLQGVELIGTVLNKSVDEDTGYGYY
ncbi:CpsD/CapB family tyrosine-protein kinase [Ectothiorhodospiraceae bacterium 2226]|nr:CpsD/CapB family tyrosine-protein kinase [Ectothiorhodospiraceae bacterium 2226]